MEVAPEHTTSEQSDININISNSSSNSSPQHALIIKNNFLSTKKEDIKASITNMLCHYRSCKFTQYKGILTRIHSTKLSSKLLYKKKKDKVMCSITNFGYDHEGQEVLFSNKASNNKFADKCKQYEGILRSQERDNDSFREER